MTKTLQALVVVCIIRLTARGADLLTGDLHTKVDWDSLSLAPVVWGVSALVVAVMLTVSLLLQNARALVVSCLAAFAVYAMYGVEALDAVMGHHPPDNWRLVTDHWCVALEMLILAVAVSFRHDITKMLKAKGGPSGMG